jgi:type 1 glutamine amidotransferase
MSDMRTSWWTAALWLDNIALREVRQQGMRRFIQSVTLAAAMATAWSARADVARPQPARPKVLAFFTAEGELDHYLFAIQAIRWLAANAPLAGYSFTATSDWDQLSEGGLQDVKLVIWLNDQPHVEAQRAGFRRYMERGGAWLGFHVVAFIRAQEPWPWYRNDFLGAPFLGNNWPSLPARLNVDDPTHPLVKNVPTTFVTPINEWYSWKPSPRTNPKIKILLTHDKSNFPLGVKNTINGGDVPVAWTNTQFKMVYLNYGHGDRIFTSPILTTIMDNSVHWLLSGLLPPTP